MNGPLAFLMSFLFGGKSHIDHGQSERVFVWGVLDFVGFF